MGNRYEAFDFIASRFIHPLIRKTPTARASSPEVATFAPKQKSRPIIGDSTKVTRSGAASD
jgi:hypothetical protein